MQQSSDYSHDPTCRLCGVLYDRHARCQCCGIYCGPNHFQEATVPYRNKRLCGLCIAGWTEKEKAAGHSISWETFKKRDKYYPVDDQLLETAAR